MEAIKNWLKNKDYSEGVALYDKYGSSNFLKRIFKNGDGDYNRKKLETELTTLLPIGHSLNGRNIDAVFVDEVVDFYFTPTDTEVKPWGRYKDPEFFQQPDFKKEILSAPIIDQPSKQDHFEYLKLIRKRDQINRQIDRNMVMLDASTSKNRRFEAAKQIKSLHRSKVKVWAEIDYFDEYGTIMPVALKPEIKTDELQRLYVQIYKAEKRLEKTDLRNREKTEKLLQEKRDRVELIRKERLINE